MATICWIGLGLMGRPMATNLVSAGHRVLGVETDPRAAELASESGIDLVSDARTAACESDIVFTMLPESRHVKEVLAGPDGLLQTTVGGPLFVDCSTIDHGQSLGLHSAASDAQAKFLDAPVSGGVNGATAGTLSIMVGGQERHFAEAASVLQDLGSYVVHMGGPGAGQAAKVVNNMVFGTCLAATCEGVVLAEQLGLDTTALYDLVTRSSGDNWALRTWYPVPGVVDSAPSNRDFTPGFTTALMIKDLGLALAAGHTTGTPLETAATAHRLFVAHAAQAGAAELDCTSLVQPLRAIATSTDPSPAPLAREVTA